MSKFLIHQKRDGTPVGVFNETDHYYRSTDAHHERYGIAVVSSRGYAFTWADFVEQQASKTPGPTAMWDTYDSDKAMLADVLDDAIRDTTYGDVDPYPFTKVVTDLNAGTLSVEDREAWLKNHSQLSDEWTNADILLAIGAGLS